MDLNPTLQLILTFGTVALLGGVVWAQFRKGSRTESSEQIKFYKEESKTYREMLASKEERHVQEIKEITTSFNDKYTELNHRFGVLQGQYTAEKEAREKAEAILKDRNPETMEFMTKTLKALGEISEFMGKINKHMEQDLKIESTITHQAQ